LRDLSVWIVPMSSRLVCSSSLLSIDSPLLERTDIPSLRKDYPKAERHEHRSCRDPAVCGVWCRFVQVVLVHLFSLPSVPMLLLRPSSSATLPISSRDRLTLWNFVVCALTAAKGVSGSGASMFAVACDLIWARAYGCVLER
jgi:hypothetical protein